MSHKGSKDSGVVAPLVVGAVVGGAVGAAVALLFAPAEGARTRHIVGEKVDELTYRLNGLVKSVRKGKDDDTIDSVADKVHDRLIEVRSRAESILLDAENQISEARNKVVGAVSGNDSDDDSTSEGAHIET